jgi:ribonuclease HII
MLFEGSASPELLAGVDEVGRGPLAGPVVAAAVVFRGSHPEGLRDSKKLTAKRREALAEEIKRTCLAWAIGRASVPEIDSMNILRASHLAMQRAIAALSSSAELVLVDGNLLPRFDVPALAVVKGDDRVPEISAASIIAKVVRDAEMTELAGRYPGYGFERHKGYATAVHLEALDRLGPTPVHRQSFAPVRAQSAKRVPATETLAW